MITQCWCVSGCSISLGCELALNGGHQHFADVRAKCIVYLANTGRAGDVDFGEIFTNYVKAYKQQAFFPQGRANLASDPAILIR